MDNVNKELYWITVRYDMPVAGTVQIFAESEEQARDILSKAHGNMRNFEIIDAHVLTEDQKKREIANRVQGEFDFNSENEANEVIDKGKLN